MASLVLSSRPGVPATPAAPARSGAPRPWLSDRPTLPPVAAQLHAVPPPQGTTVTSVALQAVQVTGQATDLGLPEPVGIVSVTVRVDGRPLIEASRSQVLPAIHSEH
jgi:hypothetical protein